MASHNGPTDAPTDVLPALAPHVIVLFGATGDLARRKLLPGLLHLERGGADARLPIVGTSLEDLDDDGFRELARSCDEFGAAWAGARRSWTSSRPAQLCSTRAPASGLAAAVGRAEGELGGRRGACTT